MGPKKIIVLMDQTKGCDVRFDTALGMAQKFDAHLTGLYAYIPDKLIESSILDIPNSFREQVNDNFARYHANVAGEIEKMFLQKVESSGRTEKSSFFKIIDEPNHMAAEVARYADIVIAGQRVGKPSNNTVDPGAVVLASGRPIFVIPQNFKPKGYTAQAVLAWNGSREAGRALSDAMMLLGPESKLTICTIGKSPSMLETLGFDISEILKHHGIQTEKMVVKKNSGNCGRDLLDFASGTGADMLIMGAYSNSRLRQKVFGGVTHYVMNNMDIPVFLSH